ncbi:MAG: hypothetical protein JJU02_00595 [Cryomorphaceae bacterium]|nr:hypothetical protein [Cryomorphaceae bacterium]
MNHCLIISSLLTFLSCSLFSQTPKNFLDSITFYNEIESYQEAFSVVEKHLNNPSTDTSFIFYYQAGISADGMQSYDQALSYFQRAVAIQPTNDLALKKQAIATVKNGDIPEAILRFEEILENNPLAASERQWLARLFAEQEMYDSALVVLNARPAIQENHFKILHAEARLYSKMRQPYFAVPRYKILLERRPKDNDLHLEYIRMLFRAHNLMEIKENADEIFRRHPTHEVSFMIGTAYLTYNKPEAALKWFVQATELSFPASLDDYYSYAALSAERLDRKKLALSFYQKAREYNPNNGYYAYFSGVIYDELGDRDRAEKMFAAFLGSEAVHENRAYADFAEERIRMYRQVDFMKGQKK